MLVTVPTARTKSDRDIRRTGARAARSDRGPDKGLQNAIKLPIIVSQNVFKGAGGAALYVLKNVTRNVIFPFARKNG